MSAALSLVRSPSSAYQAEREIPKSVSAHAKILHLRSRSNVKMMNQGEMNLLNDLREIDDAKSFTEFGSQSLYAYAVDWLELTPSVAYNLIAIMRRGKEVPELVEAIKEGRINASAARKITPVINSENKDAWLELASASSVAVIEKAVATASPKQAVQESMRYVTGERLEFKLGVGEEFHELLKELKDIHSQKSQKPIDSEEALMQAMRDSIAKHSPLAKAQRARLREERKAAAQQQRQDHEVKSDLIEPNDSGEVKSDLIGTSHCDEAKSDLVKMNNFDSKLGPFKRTPLSAATKHFVILRDGHRCTEEMRDGSRCTQTRWLDLHHIVEVANGGDNSPENLRTVCKMHHRELHEKSEPVM